MALQHMVNSRMRLILDDGVDEMSGKQLFKTKGFNNVKTEATADQLYAIATSVSGLQQRPLVEVERNDSSEITA
ncbi:hypothetical protein GCM10007063_21250 [Lentibacillus kapialis]|uniref:DUF1659 domain-containing protein n=1 Tax=Lentibacillus kapialis TaxID=340214 RepID=A0A917PYA1_9BACI|nr:DUF1659 domain-containing protein [Lentibacillus kapialis]GGJ98712.1 hypothetical protein GCM10007063_21250 [Lentibacillus kapialis]